jgi:hypothetical protein
MRASASFPQAVDPIHPSIHPSGGLIINHHLDALGGDPASQKIAGD